MGRILREIGKFYKSSLFIIVSALLVLSTLAPLAKLLADAADPVLPFGGTVTTDTNGNPVLTVNGSWQWTTHNGDCNLDRYAVGYAIDWHDGFTGNTITGKDANNNTITAHVGTATDNNVHYIHLATDSNPNGDPTGATRCGVYGQHGVDSHGHPINYSTGLWGPISHTYPKGTTTFSACVVTYDMHLAQSNDPTSGLKAGDDIAGGTGHNDDNSVEKNGDTPLGNGCFAATLSQPTLKLVKQVNNNHGGTKTPHDWTLTAAGTDGFNDTGDSTTFHTVDASVAYGLSESNVSGYTATGNYACDGGNQSGNTITLSAGQNVTCTITNDDNAPSLTVVKDVVNNNGGTKHADDFSVKVNGSQLTGGVLSNNNLTDTYTYSNPQAGTSYTVSEDQLAGYSQTSLVCKDNNTNATVSNPVNLSLGQNVTCTITNDDISPMLTINKTVINPYGNPASPSSFPLFVDSTQVTNGQSNSFNAGNHTVSETQQAGYTLTNGTCNNNNYVFANNMISLSLGLGDNVSCTLTNTAIQPELTVIKHVVGGTKTAGDFTMNVTGNPIGTLTFPGAESPGTTVGLDEGSYSVDEQPDNAYVKLLGNDCSGTISIGQTKTCTVTNIFKGTIDICHATASNSNPYVVNHPNKDGDVDGHDNHNGPIWFPGINQTWGDIIPPFDYVDNNGVTQHYPGKNWDATGQAIYNNGCQVSVNPAIHVVKDGPATAHEGDTVTYTYTVTNVGDTPLSSVTVNDNLAGVANYQSGDTNNNGVLDLTETWIYTKQYTIPTPQIPDVVNTVTACGYWLTTQKCDQDDHTLDVLHPAIQVEKFGPDTAFAGDTVTYTFDVTNTGDTPLSGLTVNDNVAGIGNYQSGDTNNNGKLDLGETWIYTKQYTIPTNQTSNITNTVTACGSDSLQLQVCNTDNHTTTILNPGIHVVKTGPSSAAAGSTVTYTFTVTNTGNTPLSSVTVNDNIAGAGTYQSGDTNNDGILETTETWIYTANYTIPANQFNSVTNTVTACGSTEEFQIEALDSNIDNSRQVCAQDKHTLVIPKVLAEATTKPPELINTGQPAIAAIVAGVTALSLIGFTTFASRKR